MTVMMAVMMRVMMRVMMAVMMRVMMRVVMVAHLARMCLHVQSMSQGWQLLQPGLLGATTRASLA